MSFRVSRLPACQCSGNIQLVWHKLTKANVELEAWMDWSNVWWRMAHLIIGRDLEMMPVVFFSTSVNQILICACWEEHKPCQWLQNWVYWWCWIPVGKLNLCIFVDVLVFLCFCELYAHASNLQVKQTVMCGAFWELLLFGIWGIVI